MMKIAFVLFSYFPFGGLQRDFYKILQACKNRGANINVYCMSWQGEMPEDITVTIPSLTGFNRIIKRNNFIKFLEKEITQEFDLTIGFNKLPGLDFYYAADSCFATKAFHERGFLYRLTSRCKQYLRFEESVFCEEHKSKVFFISARQKEQYLQHYHLSSDRIVDLPPGISRDRMASNESISLRAALRKKLAIAESDIIVLQIGSGFSIKGVDRSLRAIASLPASIKETVRYVLVGQDKPDKYFMLAKKLGILDRVLILPGTNNVPMFLQGADILLHPAYQESAGLVLLEAIVAGLPVLTTDTCGFAFHVEFANAGLVCTSPFDQGKLNTLLLTFFDQAQRIKWKTNGIEYGKTEDLYNMPEKVADILCPDLAAVVR